MRITLVARSGGVRHGGRYHLADYRDFCMRKGEVSCSWRQFLPGDGDTFNFQRGDNHKKSAGGDYFTKETFYCDTGPDPSNSHYSVAIPWALEQGEQREQLLHQLLARESRP